MTYEELINKIENWEKALEVYHDNSAIFKPVFGHDEGKKFIRVWRAENWKPGHECIHKSVFAFVDMEGNIYKPAGWKSPAKGIRGHIDNPVMEEGQLYKR